MESQFGEGALAKLVLSVSASYGGVTSFISLIDMKDELKNEIYESAGYRGVVDNFPIFERGVCLIEKIANGVTICNAEPWDGFEMEGPKGWTGDWTVNKVNGA